MSALIETKDLKKYFKVSNGYLHAVDGVNIAIDEGKTLGVVGESGCGKSTLGRAVLRLHEPTSGEIYYKGENIMAYDKAKMRELRREMQIIFQDPFSSLNPRMCVHDAIAESMIIHKTCQSKDELEKRVLELMDTVGLARRLAGSYPHELDGGRRQRIGIARALSLNPEFVICDEPVSALDVSIQAQILNLMQDLQEERKLTYMFITHNLSVVKHISNDIMVMYLGQLVEKCESEELFAHTLHPYTQALLSAKENFRLPSIPSLDAVSQAAVLMRKRNVPEQALRSGKSFPIILWPATMWKRSTDWRKKNGNPDPDGYLQELA